MRRLVALALSRLPRRAGGPRRGRPPPPAHAAAPPYVALGDSYSSGVGTRSYISDGTSCQRSTYAYPRLLAAQKGYALNFQACSGATVTTVTNNQLAALGRPPAT